MSCFEASYSVVNTSHEKNTIKRYKLGRLGITTKETTQNTMMFENVAILALIIYATFDQTF